MKKLIFVLLLLSGCTSTTAPFHVCCDDLDSAALRALSPLPCYGFCSASELEYSYNWVKERREWVKTFYDPAIAAAYNNWIDYVERQLPKAKEEMEKRERVKNLVETLPKFKGN